MTTQEILESYIQFFKARGHALTPNVSLVPSGDSTLLFTNSGMFPLVPYLSGEPHPLGKRIVNVQRAVRFDDLEVVGDNRHTTCFHMLGNWGLGDYFKAEQLPWIWDFLIQDLNLDVNRLYATVFAGDEFSPRDEESIKLIKAIYQKYGVVACEGERIFAYSGNWWKRGDAVGELGGPDSEIFYYIGDGDGVGQNPEDNEDEFIEIGNSVFMQFKKTVDGWGELSQKNIDFGGGLERLAMVVQGAKDIFETDSFWPIIETLQKISGIDYKSEAVDSVPKRAMRILADHIRAVVFMAMDGVTPSNKDQGYVMRRYLRRIVRYARKLGITNTIAGKLVPTVVEMFAWLYPDLPRYSSEIISSFSSEEDKFCHLIKSIENDKVYKDSLFHAAELNFTHASRASGAAYDIFQRAGYPPDMMLEDLVSANPDLSDKRFQDAFSVEYKKLMNEHQSKSRAGAEQKFKGGLADHSEQVTRYHTATHLLHWALRQVLGESVIQHGSNITGERLRFDFNFNEKLTDDQVGKVEELVNAQIKKSLPVNFVMMQKEEAEKTGAIHAFNEKYPDEVKVYYIGSDINSAISKEFCGGPHVKNTSEIGEVEVYKQESVGKGLRRVYLRNK